MGFQSGPGIKAIFKKKKGPPVIPAQTLSSPLNAEAEGRLNSDVEKNGEGAVVSNQFQLQADYQRIEAPLVDPDLLNRFENSIPIDNSPSLSFFGRPLIQGGSSGLGGSHVLEEEVEGVLPMEIV